ncbi:MAG: molybdopterin molybdotransferase MoeA [Thermaerobacter sp.]|nr:molybdopterin molybdotransferase MoeA [Thermaerobacter sp.]
MPYTSIEQAMLLLQRHAAPLSATETVALKWARGRTLAQDVVCPLDVPPFDRAAMDGYAARTADLPGRLTIAGSVAAGEAPMGFGPGETLRIFTGAPIPQGADTVIEQEAVLRQGEHVDISQTVPAGRNISRRGNDLRQGQDLLYTGQRLSSFEIGQLAAVGLPAVTVFRRPRVFLLTTGNELRQPGQQLAPGQIFDANQALFQSLLAHWDAEVTTAAAAGDRLDAIRSAFDRDLSAFDLVITTGGVSVGDFDFVIDFLKRDADLLFWRLDMHPGKAIAAARLRDRLVVALSGNPGAALTSWFVLVSPLLAHLHHAQWHIQEVPGRLLHDFPKPTRGTRFIRARFLNTPTGLVFDTRLSQASDAIRSYALADGLVRVPHGSGPLPAGTEATGLIIPGLGRQRLTWDPPPQTEGAAMT